MASSAQALNVSIFLPGRYSRLDASKKWAKVMQSCPSCASTLVLLMEKFGELNSESLLANPDHMMTGGWYCSKCGLHIMPEEDAEISKPADHHLLMNGNVLGSPGKGEASQPTMGVTSDPRDRSGNPGSSSHSNPKTPTGASGTPVVGQRSEAAATPRSAPTRQELTGAYGEWEAQLQNEFGVFLSHIREHLRTNERSLSEQRASMERRERALQRDEESFRQRLNKVKVTERELQERIQKLNDYKRDMVQQAKEQIRQWRSENGSGSPLKAESRILDAVLQTALGGPENHKDSVESGYSSGCASSPEKAVNGDRIRMGLAGLRLGDNQRNHFGPSSSGAGRAGNATQRPTNDFGLGERSRGQGQPHERDHSKESRGTAEQGSRDPIRHPEGRDRNVRNLNPSNPFRDTSQQYSDPCRSTTAASKDSSGPQTESHVQPTGSGVDSRFTSRHNPVSMQVLPESARGKMARNLERRGESQEQQSQNFADGLSHRREIDQTPRMGTRNLDYTSPEKRSASAGRRPEVSQFNHEDHLRGSTRAFSPPAAFDFDRRAKSAERKTDRDAFPDASRVTSSKSHDDLLRDTPLQGSRSKVMGAHGRQQIREPLSSPRKHPPTMTVLTPPRLPQEGGGLSRNHGNHFGDPQAFSVECPLRGLPMDPPPAPGVESGSWRLARPLKGRRSRSAGNVRPQDLLADRSRDGHRGNRASSWDILGKETRNYPKGLSGLNPDSQRQFPGSRNEPKYASSRQYPHGLSSTRSGQEQASDLRSSPKKAADSAALRSRLELHNPTFGESAVQQGPPDMTSTPRRDRTKRGTSAERTSHDWRNPRPSEILLSPERRRELVNREGPPRDRGPVMCNEEEPPPAYSTGKFPKSRTQQAETNQPGATRPHAESQNKPHTSAINRYATTHGSSAQQERTDRYPSGARPKSPVHLDQQRESSPRRRAPPEGREYTEHRYLDGDYLTSPVKDSSHPEVSERERRAVPLISRQEKEDRYRAHNQPPSNQFDKTGDKAAVPMTTRGSRDHGEGWVTERKSGSSSPARNTHPVDEQRTRNRSTERHVADNHPNTDKDRHDRLVISPDRGHLKDTQQREADNSRHAENAGRSRKPFVSPGRFVEGDFDRVLSPSKATDRSRNLDVISGQRRQAGDYTDAFSREIDRGVARDRSPRKEERDFKGQLEDIWRSPREVTPSRRLELSRDDDVSNGGLNSFDVIDAIAASSDIGDSNPTSSHLNTHRKVNVRHDVTQTPEPDVRNREQSPSKRLINGSGARGSHQQPEAASKRKNRPALTPLRIDRNPRHNFNNNSNNNNNSHNNNEVTMTTHFDDDSSGTQNTDNSDPEMRSVQLETSARHQDHSLVPDNAISHHAPDTGRTHPDLTSSCTNQFPKHEQTRKILRDSSNNSHECARYDMDADCVTAMRTSSPTKSKPPPPVTKPKPTWLKGLNKEPSPEKSHPAQSVLYGNGICFAADVKV